jgi:hypothetical protein
VLRKHQRPSCFKSLTAAAPRCSGEQPRAKPAFKAPKVSLTPLRVGFINGIDPKQKSYLRPLCAKVRHWLIHERVVRPTSQTARRRDRFSTA